jgi:hypothetical protein
VVSFPSAHCSNPLLPKEVLIGGFTIYAINISNFGLINILSLIDTFLTLAEPYLGNSVSLYAVFEKMNQKRQQFLWHVHTV